LLFRTDRGATGTVTVSQISPGRKNRLWFEVDGSRTSLAFDQENPESLFVGSRGENAAVLRDPANLSPAAARLSVVPGGHPMGYLDCFAAFVRDVHTAIRATGTRPEEGSPPDFPTFDDAARMVRLTEAVLDSAANRTWKEVS